MATLDPIRQPFREFARYQQVLLVLVRYGFGDMVEQLGIKRALARLRRRSRPQPGVQGLSRERRIRLVFQELGPTFVKLGQVLSTRPDLLTPELEEELAHLQDDLAPVPTVDVLRLLAEEFPGTPRSDLFLEFDEQPMAAASIGQVHRVVLPGGIRAVAKIRRPHIEQQIEVDLRILRRIAGLLSRFLTGAALYDPLGVVDEFARTIRRELDFRREARNCERFQRIFAHDPFVRVPKVFWERTTSRCLTLELMEGAKISEIVAGSAVGCDRAELARRGADMVLKTVFVHGVFHGDPHPGNILVGKDGVLQLIDFGIVGYLDEVSRRQLLDLMSGFVRRDTLRVMNAVQAIGRTGADLDLRALRFDVHDLIETYHSVPLEQMQVAHVIRDLIAMISRHQIQLPADLAVLAKVLVELDGLGRRLDPRFNMVEHVKPFVHEQIRNWMHPENIARELLATGADVLALLRALPGDVHRVMTMVKENRLEFGVVHRDTDPVTSAIRNAFVRLAGGVFATGLIVGATVLIAAQVPPLVQQFSISGLVLLVAGIAVALRSVLKRDGP